MNMYDLIKKYGTGKGEDKMWQSVAILSEAIEPMKDTDKEAYWCILRKMYGVMGDGHYNEEFAMYDVSQIMYTNRRGEKRMGAYWTVEQVEEATKAYPFPTGVNKWDKYVAANLAYSDLCKKFEDAQILDAMYLLYFADEDWHGSTKVWDYMCCKYKK